MRKCCVGGGGWKSEAFVMRLLCDRTRVSRLFLFRGVDRGKYSKVKVRDRGINREFRVCIYNEISDNCLEVRWRE